MRIITFCLALLCSGAAGAQTIDVDDIITEHILPSYQKLAEQSAQLAQTAQDKCAPESAELRQAYHHAFDAWIAVSHLRFGPSEQQNRAFALAFWPDKRAKTPKALSKLIASNDPAIFDLDMYQSVSIAARGFYALDYLLYDDTLTKGADSAYLCELIQINTQDIAKLTRDISADWQNGYADIMRLVIANDSIRNSTDAARQIFTAVATSLQFNAEQRLMRPLGTVERPRPKRAEAWRSGRSLRNLKLSMHSTCGLILMIAKQDENLSNLCRSITDRLSSQPDDVFNDLSDLNARFHLEVIKTEIETIERLFHQQLANKLGIRAGFTSLDGD